MRSKDFQEVFRQEKRAAEGSTIIRKSSKLHGEGNATTCYISRLKFIDLQKVGVV